MKRTNINMYCWMFMMALASGLWAQQGQQGTVETIKEGVHQINQGAAYTAAEDAAAIGGRAKSQAMLSAQKSLMDLKQNAFFALWNNPLFAAQFEKFLNAPAETSEEAKIYRERISRIMELLSPGNATKKNQDEAFNLLSKASDFESDANICNTIHDAVYTAANVRTEIASLIQQNIDLERQRKISEYNNLQAARARPLDQTSVGTSEAASFNKNQDIEREARMDPTKRELASIGQTIERNKMQIATAQVSAKFQLQALILQFFVQRRYQHAIIANRFYRAIFDDGDQSLQGFEQMAGKLGYDKDAGQLKVEGKAAPKVIAGVGGNESQKAGGTSFAAEGVQLGFENLSVASLMNQVSSGMKTVSKTFKSLSQLDGVANEIIRDVNEGVKVYKYLLEKNEMESAATQLAAVFTKGEYLPSVRLLSQDEKRRTLKFVQLNDKLIDIMADTPNVDAAEACVAEMKKVNPLFDDVKIITVIQEMKAASNLHVAQARIAAAKNDFQNVSAEINRASYAWPNNPEIKSFSTNMTKVSNMASPMLKSLDDFDQLYSQKNYRAIYERIDRFGVAVAADHSDEDDKADPDAKHQAADRKAKLQEVRTRMIDVESALMKANEFDRRSDHAGAWECLEIAFAKYPDDTKLGQMRAELTTQTPDFVHDIREAKSYEQKKEYGSSLAWYLRSQARYPMSDLSKQGIQRVAKQILPDAN